MTARLDDLDRRLIDALRADGRRPVAGLAAALGVSRSTVQQRLARLETTGVITGFTVVLGTAAEPGVRAQVGVCCDGRRVDQVVQAISAMDDVRRIWTTSGQIDLLVEICCATPQELDRRIDAIAAVAGVRSTTTTILLADKLAHTGSSRRGEPA